MHSQSVKLYVKALAEGTGVELSDVDVSWNDGRGPKTGFQTIKIHKEAKDKKLHSQMGLKRSRQIGEKGESQHYQNLNIIQA